MSNTNTEVLTTAYEKLQGALIQSNTVLPKLEEAVEKGNLDNYATTSDLEENTQQLDSRLVVQENKKISETDITETLLAQITGTAAINAVPADYSLGNRKFALPIMLGIKSKNLFDVTDITDGKFILNTTGVETTNTSYCCSNYIKVIPGENIRISGTKEQGAFYGSDKAYKSGYVYANEVTTVPNDCYYIRLSMKKTEANKVQLEYGDTVTEYTSYNPKLDLSSIVERLPLSKLDSSILSGNLGVNLFNKDTATENKYINSSTGVEGTLNGFCASNYIKVTEGETYYLSGTKQQLAFYDNDKVYVSGLSHGNELSTIPAGVKYVRLTMKTTEIDSVQLQKDQLTAYEMYGRKLLNNNFSLENLEFLYEKIGGAKKIITVKKDGTGDFTSFTSAVKSIAYTDKLNRYEIQVYTGEYDIISELGGDTFLATVESNSSANQGLTLPNYVDVTGIGNVVLKGEIADDKATVNNTTRVSTLNYNKTNRIKNIKVTAKNMRYAIHSETNGTIENADIEMENVQSIHLGNTNSSHWKWCCGFGMGFGGNGKYKFKNCLFETKSEIYGNGGFICHNWNNQSSGSILDFECCEFTNTETGEIGFRYGSMDDTYTDIFNFKGCQFNGKLRIKEESTGAGINAGFYGYGNSSITTHISEGLSPTVRLL